MTNYFAKKTTIILTDFIPSTMVLITKALPLKQKAKPVPVSKIAKANATKLQFGQCPVRKLYSGLPNILIVIGLYLFWLPIHNASAQIITNNILNDTVSVMNSYLENRAKIILQNGPSIARRLDQVQQQISHDDELVKRHNAFWAGGSMSGFNSEAGNGRIQIAHFGADYLVEPDFLIGLGAQLDWTNYNSQTINFVTTNNNLKFITDVFDVVKTPTTVKFIGSTTVEPKKSRIDGFGYLIGPYLTTRLSNNLYFDGRMNWGRSSNSVSPYDTFRDDFSSSKFLITGALIGEYKFKNTIIMPTVNLSYMREQTDSFTNKTGNHIPNLEVETGTINFGPTFTKHVKMQNGSTFSPSFTINGIWTFAQENSASNYIENTSIMANEGLRAKLQAGGKIINSNGVGFNFQASYDGIGDYDYESWALNIGLAKTW